MSADPVAEFLAREERGIVLASGAEEDVTEQLGAIFYTIPAGGTCPVYDKKEHPRDKQQRPDLKAAPVSVEPAAVIVRALLSADRLGRKGAYVVMGDGKDDERRAAGRKRWLEYRSAQAQTKQLWWLQYVSASKATPNSITPTMPQHVRVEMDFLRKYAREINIGDRKRFICTLDGYDFDTYAEAVAYVKNMFSHELDRLGDLPEKYIQDNQIMAKNAADAGARARAEAMEAPVETSVVDLEVGAKVLEEAQAKGVKLTRAEKKALLDGKQDAIKAAQDQIAQAPASV